MQSPSGDDGVILRLFLHLLMRLRSVDENELVESGLRPLLKEVFFHYVKKPRADLIRCFFNNHGWRSTSENGIERSKRKALAGSLTISKNKERIQARLHKSFKKIR
jgi:hypothetical protein